MRKLAIKASRDNAAKKTHFNMEFPDGETRTFDLPDDHPLYQNFAAHGVTKKVRDLLAGSKPMDKQKELLDKLLASFAKNDWNATRNGDGKPVVSILARALHRVSGKSLEECIAYVKTLSKADQAKARKDDRIAPVIRELQKEDAGEEDGGVLEGFFHAEEESEAA